mgnify:FL=1
MQGGKFGSSSSVMFEIVCDKRLAEQRGRKCENNMYLAWKILCYSGQIAQTYGSRSLSGSVHATETLSEGSL